MKRAVKAVLFVLGAVLVATGGFAFWQKDNLKAVYDSQKYTEEELLQQIDASKEEMKQELEQKYPALKITDISAEDETKILKGELTLQEVAKKYNLPLESMLDMAVEQAGSSVVGNSEQQGGSSSETQASSNAPASSVTEESVSSSSSSVSQKKEDKIIGDHIGRMYGLKAKYLSKLGALEGQAITEYKNSGGKASKKEIGYKYARIGASYEGSCDAEVEAILGSLESELSAIGADTSIVKKLRSSYYQEKRAKKAYYISQFQ